MGCLRLSLFSQGLSFVWVFMPAPSWSPRHSKRKALHISNQKSVRRLGVYEEGWGGWDREQGRVSLVRVFRIA